MKIEGNRLIKVTDRDIDSNGVLRIPDNIEIIGNDVIEELYNIKEVVGKNVKEIYDGNFYDCENLIIVNLPKVIEIRNLNFNYCKSLTTINLPKVKEIGNRNFYNCKNITTINLPKVKEIGKWNFQYCKSLTTISLSKVSRIGNYNFYNCENLKTINLGNQILNVQMIDSEPFMIEQTRTIN